MWSCVFLNLLCCGVVELCSCVFVYFGDLLICIVGELSSCVVVDVCSCAFVEL